MGDLSKYFSRSEFACKCGCGFDTVDHELIARIEEVASMLEYSSINDVRVVIHINSGCRCPIHNKAEGGSNTSLHMQAKAADLWMEAEYEGDRNSRVLIPPQVIYNTFNRKYPNKYGLIIYDDRIHFDVRSNAPYRGDKR